MDIGRWRLIVLHSTTYIILQHRCLRVHAQKTMVFTPPSSPPAIKPTHQTICTFLDPRPVYLTKRCPFYECPTKPPYDHLSNTPSQFTTQKSFQITHPGSIQNHQPKILPNQSAKAHAKFRGETPSDEPSSHPLTRPRKVSSI